MYKQFVYNIARWLLPEACFFMRRTYKYRVEITHAKGITEKLHLFIQCFWRAFIDRKKILFYPVGPVEHHVMYKILLFLGYSITTNPTDRCNLAIKWWRAPDGNPYAPQDAVLSQLPNMLGGTKMLNIELVDITKERVASVFQEAFGYSVSIDPLEYSGKCVMKTNWNALHLGKIVECPVDTQQDGFVYEKIIRNEVENGLVEDIRVLIFGDIIPFVYLKRRPIEKRFLDRDQANKSALIAEVDDLLSKEEVRKILCFSKRLGLDYCEIDVLRDRDDGRIYIVDANCCPAGPPFPISKSEEKTAIIRLAGIFNKAFQV
ncbi:MAG: hypothetical protein GY941_13855 [Planctomycetes bacterium]|nr:hypothetical protein [Planctomycetota bacterium]